ncbi:hypothetical protein COCCU_00420 [Corynebacterium occultum]|uniref:Secreted protein n=1 Tax=Corynebacterium occultum TaxID=2675219 RepID=A0A6B8VKW8_9CORY|nr:hypothetical protein [Corynebacterium occultum]QGU06052.1 hypothetical protein COCCU_00420 [Corynebacterium occultum]
MTLFSRFSLKTGLATAAVAASFAILAPAAANADPIDDALNALPAGQISCEQAESYWTNTDDYNQKVAMAQAVSRFDSRGGEINAALARVDEAANRCGLKGGAAPAQNTNGGNTAPVQNNTNGGNTAPVQNNNGGNNGGNNTPAQNNAIEGAPTITVPTAPGTPTITVPAFNMVNVVMPDLLRIVQEFLAQWGINIDLTQFLR